MSQEIQSRLNKLQQNIESVIRGKSDVVKNAIIAMLAQGHLLIEDVPGVGKTTLAHLIALSLSCSFQRIQFTSDLLPSDILGVTIYDPEHRQFEFRKGPIFANIILADEINRTTPKTQSSLLEAMNNFRVSMDKATYDLPRPFMVIATQNPIEFHGTFPLPKSQMDRFLMRLHIGYPDLNDEVAILRDQKSLDILSDTRPVLDASEILELQKAVEEVKVDDDLIQYIGRIVAATRNSSRIELGASPRGALALRRAAQARACYENRDYCIPDDIKSMAASVLAHRIQVARTFESGGLGAHHDDEQVLLQVISEVEVPL